MMNMIHRIFEDDKTNANMKLEACRSNTFSRWFIRLFLMLTLRYRTIATFYSDFKLQNLNFTHLLF